MGRSSSTATTAALLAAMLLMTTTLFTATHCANNNQTSWLIADFDLDSELMMDSEISRRTLQAADYYSKLAMDRSKRASCDRQDQPNCNPPKNSKPLPPNCDIFNKDCHKY